MFVKFANNTLTNIFGHISSGQNQTDRLDSITESHAMVGKSVGGAMGLVGSLIILFIVVRRNMGLSREYFGSLTNSSPP